MAARTWKHRQPGTIRQAMEWCLEHARVKLNRSVDHVAELMGQSNKWVIYKWLESGRLPAVLIRPFENACGIDYVTRYIGHSSHKLLIDIPNGQRATGKDINSLQASFTESISLLLRFYEGESEADETIAALLTTMEQLAWHRGAIERNKQPELDFLGGE